MDNCLIKFLTKRLLLGYRLLLLGFGFSAVFLFAVDLGAQGLGSGPNIGKVIVIRSSVTLVRNGQELPIGSFGKKLKIGDTVVTHRGGKAHIIFNNGSELFLAPSAKIEISKQLMGKSKRGIKQFILSVYGKIRLQIKKTKIKHLQVKTKTAIIAVKGTDFVVLYENQITTVATIEGLVNLASIVNQLNVDIPPGKMSSISPSGDVMPLSKIAGEILKGVEFAGERLTESDISGEKIKN